MLNLGIWIGGLVAGSVIFWSFSQPGAGRSLLDPHGLVVVFGGTIAALLISTPLHHIFSALQAFLWAMLPSRFPSSGEVASEIGRLARKARGQGGLLALRGESPDFAGGFLARAIEAAAACGETSGARQILDVEIRRRRFARQEDANVFRTVGTLAPMFGLLGTLLGMLNVLSSMSDPAKLAPAMAMALSSAFIGISMANFICIPIAGQVRLLSIRETQTLEMIVEGVLAIAQNQPPYQIDLRMSAYAGGATVSAAGESRESSAR